MLTNAHISGNKDRLIKGSRLFVRIAIIANPIAMVAMRIDSNPTILP